MGNAEGKESVGYSLNLPPQEDSSERPDQCPVIHYHHVSGGRSISVLQPLLVEQYQKNHRMLALRKRPLCEHFVGIFCDRGEDEGRTQWKHSTVPLWLHGQLRSQTETSGQGKKKKNLLWVTDPPCLADAITRYTQHGERFVSVSMTGVQADGDYVIPGATNTARCPHVDKLPFKPRKRPEAIGVELIFEEPVQRPSEKYVYHVAPVPVTVHHCHRGKGKNFLGLANIMCDWLGTFNQYLHQGWRLVDIYIDIRPSPGVVTTRTMTRFQHIHKRGRFTFKYITWKPVDMNSLWIFEKPAARERELAPVYEGTVVPFSFQLDKTNCKTNKNLPDLNWDHVIWDMGKKGWELASFVDVAGFRPANPSSNNEFIVTSLMFFQRPIPPPSYDFVATAGWDLSVQSGPAQGSGLPRQNHPPPSAPPLEGRPPV